MTTENTEISILVINLDHCMSKTTVNSSLKMVHDSVNMHPIVRIFGSTSTGLRACAYVHGVYPYVYFRPENLLHGAFETSKNIEIMLPIFEKALEELLFLRREQQAAAYNNNQSFTVKKRKYIQNMEIVQKLTMYGMWTDPLYFVKVYLYDPGDISRLATILDEGALAGIQMQSYEAHIPCLLQFTSDYNVSPMGWLQFDAFKLRLKEGEVSKLEIEPTPNEVKELTTDPSPKLALSFSGASPFKVEDKCAVSTSAANDNFDVDLEIKKLLEGLTEKDFIPTQLEPFTSHVTAAPQPIQQIVVDSRPPPKLERLSTCELELDSFHCHIRNRNQPKTEFGAELWEEERLRCLAKGLEVDQAPTPPSTQTVHRKPLQTELEFAKRLRNLQCKGRALQRTASRKLKSPQAKHNNLLSQFVETKPDHTSDIALEEGGIADWATEAVDETLEEADMHDSIIQSFMDNVESIVEDYVKTQASQHPAKELDISLSASKQVEDLKEEELSAIKQELDDILSSTQAEPSTNLHKPLSFDSKEAFPMQSEYAWSSSPLPDSIPETTKIEEAKVPVSAMTSESQVDSAPSSARTNSKTPIIRKRTGEENRLTSVFKKRKKVGFSSSKEVDEQIHSTPQADLKQTTTSKESSSGKKIKKMVSFRFDNSNEREEININSTPEDFHRLINSNTSQSPSVMTKQELSRSLVLVPTFAPPNRSNLKSMHEFDLPLVVNKPAVYGKFADFQAAKSRDSRVTGNSDYLNYMIEQHPVKYEYDLEQFDGGRALDHNILNSGAVQGNWRVRCLIPTFLPPKRSSILSEFSSKSKSDPKQISKESWKKSQICTPTQTPMTLSDHQSSAKVGKGVKATNKMTRIVTLSMELFCNTRKDLLPNPKYDAVQMIVWSMTDIMNDSENEHVSELHGVIAYTSDVSTRRENIKEQMKRNIHACHLSSPELLQIFVLNSESDLFDCFFAIVKDIDPDFLVGYENQSNSFGYLIKRGQTINKECLKMLSRLPQEKPSFRNESMSSRNADDDVMEDGDAGIFIKGRTFINNWQLMKSELKLSCNTIQNLAEEVLQLRIPSFSCAQLTRWYQLPTTMHKTIKYVFQLTKINLLLLQKLDIVRKISECARLYGIDFYSVMHRGSQYRVEAALLLKAHAKGFLLLSPSRQKVAAQAPMEVIPLVLEPRSRFYHDPVLVLDFQSLYPSMMIAYNLCFSTIMGKLRPGTAGTIDTTGKLGVVNYPEKITAINSLAHLKDSTAPVSIDTADNHLDKPYIAPNGSVFCSKNVRHGILPMMVKEMLTTRIMVKRAIKRHAGKHHNSVLEKVLDARQLAIKLLSNVTYGYTSAGFSGRMPMAELADAIVQSGRSTLEWTMNLINTHPTWKAEVVYGDTDSVFVHLPGRNLQQAFAIGEEISREITAKSPEDVVLKFEKVYYPCILVTKKRYVGNCYETVTQKQPHLDAKGIEVVRRDQCPATIKIQEKVLRILFETRDMSLVKEYLVDQWSKMLEGGDRVLLKDFIFSKEVRFGHYASVSSQPPGAVVATKAVLVDEMAVPPYNWRVPYVVVHGLPNAPLKNLVYDPKEVLRRGSNLRLNFTYYITKCINPALDRVLSLCGVDVNAWLKQMPRPRPRSRHINYENYQNNTSDDKTSEWKSEYVITNNKKKLQMTMDQFTIQARCELCDNDALPLKNLCKQCLETNQMESLIVLSQRLNLSMSRENELSLICQGCSGSSQPSVLFTKGEMIGPDCCQSLECPIFHERTRLITRLEDFQMAMHDVNAVNF